MNTTATQNRIATVLAFVEAARNTDWRETNGIDNQADHYVEPGYTDPDAGLILFANWNPSSFDEPTASRSVMVRAERILERLGVACEWSDQWATCGGCGGAVQTEPDSHGWRRSFVLDDGELTCRDCLTDDPDSYVDSYLLNNEETADTFDVDLPALGFVEVAEGENGMHPGQTDKPADKVLALRNADPDRLLDFVFVLDSVGQFDARFSMHVRPVDFLGEDDSPADGLAIIEKLKTVS